MKRQRTILHAELLEDRTAPATWGSPWPNPTGLTLSFAPDGTSIGGQASNLFQTMNAIAPTAAWETAILCAVQTWASQANINVSVVADDGLPFGTAGAIQGDPRFGDIRIGACNMAPGSVAAATPFELAGGTWSGDIEFNSAALFGVNGQGQYDLFSVALHEAGHVFGLPDNAYPASVMDEQYQGVLTGLSASDIAALQSIYGGPRTLDQNNPSTINNQLATAMPLNSLQNVNGLRSTTVSADISTLADQDFYSFSTLLGLGGVDLTVRTAGISLLTPRATVYNALGNVIVSNVSTTPQQGGFTIDLTNVAPLSTYYIEIQSGQQNVFGIGSYSLTMTQVPLVNSLLRGVTATVTYSTAAANTLISNDPGDVNSTFATATRFPTLTPGPNGSYYDTYRSSLDGSSNVDFYRLQAPPSGAGVSDDVMTAMVWGLEDDLDPLVRVYDAQHNLLQAQVLVNDGFSFVVQIADATPGATYYVEVLPSGSSSTQTVGNYCLGIDFSTQAESLQKDVAGTLTASHPAAVDTLVVSGFGQLFHFVLSATTPGSSAAATVQMTIIDATGHTVDTLAAGTAEPFTGNVILNPGQYTVVFSEQGKTGATLDYQLLGETLTDPQGPESNDPTKNPGGSGSGGSGWNGGGTGGIPPQNPTGNPSNGGNSSTVVDLYSPGDQTNSDGDTVSLPLSSSDSSNNPLTFSASNLPPGLSIDPDAGTIYGVVDSGDDQESPYIVTVTATDTTANVSATQTFDWTINFNPVSVTSPGDQLNYDGDTVNVPVTASDSEGNPLTYSASNLPPGLSIDPNAGTITGTIAGSADAGSPYLVTVTATDSVANASQSATFNWTVSNPVNLNSPGDQSNYDGDTINLSMPASDAAGNPLTFTASNLPPGLSIDPNAGTITGIIAGSADANSPYSVMVTATDTVANVSESVTFNWTVSNPLNLNSPGDQSNYDGGSVNVSMPASDAAGNPLTFTASNLPPGLSIDPNAGTITGAIAGSADTNSPYVVTVTATDSVANVSQTVTFNWTVGNPVNLSSPGDQSNYDGDAVSLPASGSDAVGNPLTYSALNLPPGLTIDPSAGTISGSIAGNADTNSPYAVTITATDSTANASTSITFNWTVQQPVITLYGPGDQTNSAGDSVYVGVSASISNNDPITFSISNLPPGLSIDANSGIISGTIAANASSSTPYVITVTATDPVSGVTTSVTFDWTVC